jgi:hypothetical protein
MSAGDMLDQAIRIYRRNFVPLVSIVAIINVPFALIQVIVTLLTNPFAATFPGASQSFDPEAFNTTTLLVGQGITSLAALLAAIAVVFQNAALVTFIAERFLDRPITARQAYRRALSRWLSLLIAVFLLALVNVVLLGGLLGIYFVPFIGLAALGAGASSQVTALAGMLSLLFCCLLIPALVGIVFLDTRWSLFMPSIMLENYNSTGGMGRSWKLVKGSFWRVFFMLLILIAILYLFTPGPILLFSMGAVLLPNPLLLVVINSVASSLITIIITPLQLAVLTILYFDLRIRKEGFDLQLQMQNLPPPLPAPAAPEPPLDLPPLFSRADYSK